MNHHNCLLALFSALTILPVFAQQPVGPASGPQTPTVKANAEEVLLDVIVRDKKGKPITDLKPEELTVSDNGFPQRLSGFAVRARD